jgi:hypothetical protein
MHTSKLVLSAVMAVGESLLVLSPNPSCPSTFLPKPTHVLSVLRQMLWSAPPTQDSVSVPKALMAVGVVRAVVSPW